MIVVVSRVSNASIVCDGKPIGSIGKGLVCFVGLEKGDTVDNVRKGAQKVCEIKVFENDEGRLGLSLKDIEGLPFAEAKPLFEEFCKALNTEKKVCSVFGSYMEIAMNHDGPVNVILRT